MLLQWPYLSLSGTAQGKGLEGLQPPFSYISSHLRDANFKISLNWEHTPDPLPYECLHGLSFAPSLKYAVRAYGGRIRRSSSYLHSPWTPTISVDCCGSARCFCGRVMDIASPVKYGRFSNSLCDTQEAKMLTTHIKVDQFSTSLLIVHDPTKW